MKLHLPTLQQAWLALRKGGPFGCAIETRKKVYTFYTCPRRGDWAVFDVFDVD